MTENLSTAYDAIALLESLGLPVSNWSNNTLMM